MSTSINTLCTITCDGPRCASRHGTDKPVVLAMSDEAVRSNPEATPDGFARFIKVLFSPFEDKLVEFCGRRCLEDYLDYSYIEPKSPREIAEQKASLMARALSQADGEAA
jgi:hypothetical protein